MDATAVDRPTSMRDAEHWLTLGTGALMLFAGARRRSVLGACLAISSAPLLYRGITGHWPAPLDRHASDDTRKALGGARGIHVRESVRLERPIADVYHFWRRLENLPQFMPHLESVERVTDTLSRWRARGPGGKIVEWNAEIINEVANQVIGWRSIEGSDVVSAGSVHFDDAGPGRGTHVRVRMQYSPPGGKVGAAVARLLGRDAATEIREDLRRFKQLLETGEVPTTHGQPRG